MQTIRVTAPLTPDRTAVAWLRRFWPPCVLYVAARLISDRIFTSDHVNFIHAVLSGAMFAALFAFAVDKIKLRYDLVVADDQITAQYVLSFKTIHRGRVRTIVERGRSSYRRAGMVASDKGKISMWLWGGVFIPSEIPEYDRLRETILAWRA